MAAPAAEEEDVIELSPFTVEAEQGWVATESVSGTRLRSELRDVPSQIETFTKDFMEDLALNSVDDALIYSVNSENNTEYIAANAETSSFYVNGANRVRGLDAGTNSQNLFRSAIAPDNYNVDSTSVVSGPNSTLFGMGGASGTYDTNSARATMKNALSLRFQYSSVDSKRASIDANRVLIKDKLAFRFMALSKDEFTEKKPNHDDDGRYTLALTFRPFRSTNIRLRYEKVDREFNRAARTMAYDYVTPWLNANEVPGSPYTSGMPGYDNRTAIPANVSTTTRIFGANNANIVFVTDTPDQSVMGWGRAVQVLNPSAATVYSVPNPSFESGRTVTFMDDSVVPKYRNVMANFKGTELGGTIRSAFLEQKIANNLFLELAYNKEESYQKVMGVRGQGISAVYADANLYLPAVMPGETTPRPNPNFGRYYVDMQSNHNLTDYSFEDLRATLSYELDLARGHTNWVDWLGRHRIALVGMDSEARTRDQLGFIPRIYDNPTIPGRALTAQAANNWAINATRQVRWRSYLDSSFKSVDMVDPIDGMIRYVDGTGTEYFMNSSVDSGLTNASGQRLGNTGNALSGTWSKTDTWLLAYQGYFLPDKQGNGRVIVTYGYREDGVRTAAPDVVSRTQDSGVGRPGLYPLFYDATWDPFGERVTGDTRNTGVVVRPWSWLSLSYSDSATWDVSTVNYNPYGQRYPGTAGSGKDYGIRLDLFDRRVSIRLNKFENALGPTRVTNTLDDGFRTPASQLEERIRELDPALSPPDNWFVAGTNYGYNSYHVYAYRTSEGYELSVDLQPVRNWSIRINGAKSEAKEDLIGHDWIQWLEERLPVWQSVVAKNGEVDVNGQPVTWQTADVNVGDANENRTLAQYYYERLESTQVPLMKASEGRVSDGSRGLRANFITTYRVSEGRMKGWSIGGALRWRRAPVIGYPVAQDEFGNSFLDVENGYRGEDEYPIDLTLGYRGKLEWFKGVSYSAQLNVRNAFASDGMIPVTSFTDGTIARVATVEPRLLVFSFGFDF